jgi:hypothetical protein
MVLTKPMKIWLIVTHALIIMGMGHGVAIFGIIEAAWLTRLFNPLDASDNNHNSELALRIFSVISLLGQLLVFLSMRQRQIGKVTMFFIGLLFLWISLLTFACSIEKDRDKHLLLISCVPFLLCTIWILLGGTIRAAWGRLLSKI